MPKFRTLQSKPVKQIQSTMFTHLLGKNWIETDLDIDYFSEIIYLGSNQAGMELFAGIPIHNKLSVMVLTGIKGDEFN